MRKKKHSRFLITGVSGYWGAALVRSFSGEKPPEKLVGIDVKKPARRRPLLDFRRADVRDPGLRKTLESERIDTVVHLAFALNVFSPDRKIRDVNIVGTRNLLDCCVKAGVRKFVLASSTTVYGAFPENDEPFTEDVPARMTQGLFYTRDKVEIEDMVEEYRRNHGDTRFVIIRPSVITGPSMGNILSFLLRVVRLIPAPVFQNPPLQFVHEDDLARATRLLMERECEGIYNVTGDGGVPYRDVIHICGGTPVLVPRGILAGAARRIERLRLTPPIAGFVDLISYPWEVSNGKIKRDFNFAFRYTSREALLEFARRIPGGARG
ncbi:MAG: NAD-dependent epimerase/dehydratase family protein [bacterium]